jgi:hypothetical protein
MNPVIQSEGFIPLGDSFSWRPDTIRVVTERSSISHVTACDLNRPSKRVEMLTVKSDGYNHASATSRCGGPGGCPLISDFAFGAPCSA